MKFHSVEMVGKFINQKLVDLPTFDDTRDQGRFVWMTDGSIWYGSVDAWVMLKSSAGNNIECCMTIVEDQPGHTFLYGDLTAIRHNGTLWVKALANNVNTCGTHIAYVLDDDTFIAVSNGRVTIDGGHGLTTNHYYFVDYGNPGEYTSTEPEVISNPLIFVENSDTVHVLPYRPCIY